MVEKFCLPSGCQHQKNPEKSERTENITIPHYEQLTKDITNALEEKEREEFTRLKVIKRMQTKKKA